MEDPSLPKAADIDDFLSRVDTVEALIRGLKEGSIDPSRVPDSVDDVLDVSAVARGDGGVVRVTASKTVVTEENTRSSAQGGGGLRTGQTASVKNDAPSPMTTESPNTKKKGPTNYAAWERFAADDEDAQGALSVERVVNSSSDPVDGRNGTADICETDCGVTPVIDGPVAGDAFMRQLEEDAAGRRARKDRREAEAAEFKAAGNIAFKAGRFCEAVERYSDAIALMPYSTVLLTNRAQAYHKLGEFRSARSDCTRALDIDPKCVKALVRRGLAFHCEGCFSDALNDFAAAVKLDPSSEKDVRAYVDATEHSQMLAEADLAAHAALRTVETGGTVDQDAVTIVSGAIRRMLAAHTTAGEVVRAAVETKSALLRADVDVVAGGRLRAVFRVSGGLGLLGTCPHTNWCVTGAAASEMASNESRAVVAAVLDLLDAACTDDAANQAGLVDTAGFSAAICVLISDRSPRVVERGLQLLSTITRSPRARASLLRGSTMLLQRVLDRVVSPGDPLPSALFALSHMCLESSARMECARMYDTLVPPLIARPVGGCSAVVVGATLAALGNMAMDPDVRTKFCHSKCVEKVLLIATKVASQATGPLLSEAAPSLLALMVNLSLDEGPLALFGEADNVALVVRLAEVGDAVTRQRAATLLSRLAKTESVASALSNDAGLGLILRLCADEDLGIVAAGVRCLAASTQRNPPAWEAVSRLGGANVLVRLLDAVQGHLADAILANAALALANCAQHDVICASLTTSDCVDRLVVLAKREPGAVQENAAVALARLARGHPTHLDRLRTLGAIEILHTRLSQTRKP
eukprot:Opistho-2@1278